MIKHSTNAIRPLPDELADRIDLAAPVFADNGLDATRLDDLAKATGIPRATPASYTHLTLPPNYPV
mgnify:CR=1 FL=1